jgi:hypothetical protein
MGGGREVKTVRGETKGADKVRGVKGVRRESVVGERLEGIMVGKARKMRRWGQRRLRRGVEMRFGGALRGKIGYIHRPVLGGSVGVFGAGGDKLLLGLRVKGLMGLREGNIANARCWEIKPLSLEHEGHTQLCRCARSFGIIGGKRRPIFDSLAVGGGGGGG